MRSLVLTAFWLIAALGCAKGSPMDAGFDAARARPDAESIFRDAGPDAHQIDAGADAGLVDEDAGGSDAGPDAAMDAGSDAGLTMDAGPGDAGTDAGPISTDAGLGGACPSLSVGHSIVLDGSGDPSEFVRAQRLTPGGLVGSTDEYGITWDRSYLYVLLASPVFADGLRPLHVYIEARGSLGTASMATGKEYGGLTAQLPFSATHLIAIRRTSVSGGPAYNGVYTSAGAWTTQTMELQDGVDVFAEGSDTMAVRVPWSALGCVDTIRLTSHVVNGPISGNEWKDFAPTSTTPWMTPGGGYYEIDLTADPAVTGWTLR